MLVRGEAPALERAVGNLVRNARRHGPAGGGIDIAAGGDGRVAWISVADEGPGLAPEEAARAFERFWRGSGARGEGSGLGLAIVRAIAERHGGRVSVDGSRFTIELPALKEVSRPARRTPVMRRRTPDGDRPHRVLIVGGGFGGLAAARTLRRAPVEVTLVDRANHHLFQPLLYQVASGILTEAEIAPPLRGVLRRQANARVLLADVDGFDLEARAVLATGADGEPLRLGYDTLVVAAGACGAGPGQRRGRRSRRRSRRWPTRGGSARASWAPSSARSSRPTRPSATHG